MMRGGAGSALRIDVLLHLSNYSILLFLFMFIWGLGGFFASAEMLVRKLSIDCSVGIFC